MNIKTLRWQKTRKLVSDVGGISRFAEKIGRSQSQVNRFAGPNPVTGIGDKIARLIEKSFSLDYAYLDKQGSEDDDLSRPAETALDAIKQAYKAATDYIEAQANWLKIRSQAVYMIRSELREQLMNDGVQITSEFDDSYAILLSGQPARLDLFIPIPGFNVYRYLSSRSMKLPDVLAINCLKSTGIDFYLVPLSVLETLPENTTIKLDAINETLNGQLISKYLNNTSSIL